MKYYKVSEEDLRYFIECRAELEALIAGGVDNWSWYGESKFQYLEDIKEQYGIDRKALFGFGDIVNREVKEFEEV